MILFDYQGNVIVLPSPSTFPSLSLDLKVFSRRSMAGTLYGYISTPIEYSQTIEINLQKCPVGKRVELINFIKLAAGNEFTYIDQYNTTWTVRLLTEPTTIVDQAKNIHLVGLELQGTK